MLAVATGLPNWGKSYWDMAVMEDFHKDWGLPDFRGKYLDHANPPIVFNSYQFWLRMQTCGEWEWTLWDEPNKGLSHRDWYLDMNKAVVTYIQTFRFKHKPLLLALPHIRLLDKSARAVMVGEAMMKRPGLARVHQLEPDYFGTREFFKYFRGEVEEYLPNRQFRNWYEEAKMKFHETDFPKEAFQQPTETGETKSKQTVELERVEGIVRQDPLRFGKPSPDGKSYVLNAQKIEALTNTTARVAGKARIRLEDEFGSKASPKK